MATPPVWPTSVAGSRCPHRRTAWSDGRNALIVPVAVSRAGTAAASHVVLKRVTRDHAANKEEGPLREAFLNSASREVAFYSDLAARCAAEAAAEAFRHRHP